MPLNALLQYDFYFFYKNILFGEWSEFIILLNGGLFVKIRIILLKI